MGFDKNTEGKPVVQPQRRATQVNIWMVVGVVLFFIFGAVGMAWLHHRVPPHSGNIQPTEQHQP